MVIPFKEGNMEEPGDIPGGYDMMREVDGVHEMRHRLEDCARFNAGSER